MPLAISSTAIQEKNKLSTGALWHLLLEVTIPRVGGSDVVRVTSNNETVTWNGQAWDPFPFEMEEIVDDGKGSVPRVDVRISNVNRVMESYVLAYDTYIKSSGYTPVAVKMFTVVSTNLASSIPEVEYWFELKQPKTTAQWATFTLGGMNPFNRRCPQDRIMKNHCRFIFKGPDGLCGYTGGETVCNKTYSRCVTLGNKNRYGGFPGVGRGGINALGG